MWYIQSNLIFYGLTISFHRSKEVFVCCLIVSLRCVFWVAPLHTGGGIDSPRPASQRAAAFVLTAAMLITLTAPAFAETWYIENGDITVKASGTEGKNTVSQGNKKDVEDTNTIITNQKTDTASSHTVTIDAGNDKVEVTLEDVNIKADSGSALTSKGDVTLTLKGDNHLTGGNGDTYGGSGISSSGSLTISGGETDSLTAQGGSGENGGDGISSKDLTISGGTVTATGGNSTGIVGSGGSGIHSGGDVTISGGTVTATGGDSTGSDGSGGYGIYSSSTTTISGGTVTATGGDSTGSYSSGGHGISSSGSLTISGGSTVTANGGNGTISGGDGICSNGGVTISGGSTVTANGGNGGRLVGGDGIRSSSGGVTISGGSTVTANGGNGGSIGGGSGIYSNGSLTISGGTVNANGGSGKNGNGGNGIIGSGRVAISGGTVNAAGGDGTNSNGGEGIYGRKGIDLSGSLELTAKAGSPNGKALSQDGNELDLNTIKDKLGPGAKVTVTDANGETKQVSIPRPVEPEKPVIPEESSSSSDGGSSAPSAPASSLPGLTVTDKSGAVISYTSTQSGNTLTVCVGRFTASLRASLSALRQLRAEGIETITFQTVLCSTTLSVDELLAMGGEDAEAVLTHRSTDSSLTVG